MVSDSTSWAQTEKSSMADFTSNWEEDPMYRLKNLEETDSIKEYYEAFDSIQRCLALPEEFLLSWFVAGLREDTRIEVRSFRPRTVFQAYACGRVYEIAYPKGRPLQSVPNQKCSSPTSLVSVSIPAVQEDDDHELQLEPTQQSFSFPILVAQEDNLEEEANQEFARQVFDENSRYDVMPSDDVLNDGMLKNDDAMIIDQDFAQIETRFEQILMKEPYDMHASHMLDEMPMSNSSQETQSLGQFSEIIDDGLEFQIVSGSSVAKDDHLKAFENPKLHQSTIITEEEQQDFKNDPKVSELMNGQFRPVEIRMDQMGVQCFDPGGGLHNSVTEIAGVEKTQDDSNLDLARDSASLNIVSPAARFFIKWGSELIVENDEYGVRRIAATRAVKFIANQMPYDRGKVKFINGDVGPNQFGSMEKVQSWVYSHILSACSFDVVVVDSHAHTKIFDPGGSCLLLLVNFETSVDVSMLGNRENKASDFSFKVKGLVFDPGGKLLLKSCRSRPLSVDGLYKKLLEN